MDYLRSGADADIWPDGGRGDDIPLYSQEYVSALLEDNERVARDLVARNGEIEGLRKRAAELEAKNAQLKKELHNEGAANAHAYERIRELEKRLATPVRLPDTRQSVSGDRYQWSDGVFNYKQDAIAMLRAAGFTVGDEQ